MVGRGSIAHMRSFALGGKVGELQARKSVALLGEEDGGKGGGYRARHVAYGDQHS